MMRILVGAVISLALCTAAQAAAQETLPLPVRIEGPAHIELSLVKSERRDGGPEQRAAFTYEVSLTSADKDTGRRGVIWRLASVDGVRVEAGSSPSPDIRMTVDQNLTPVSLDNLDEVIDFTRRQLAESGELDEAGESAIQMLAALTPETAAPLFTRDATMVAQGQGTELIPGETNTYEFEGALPWGGASVTMIGSYQLAEVNRTTGKARVIWSQEIDPASLHDAVPAMIDALISQSGEANDNVDVAAKMRAEMAGATLDNSRRCEFTIDMATGLAEKIDCLTTIAFVAGDESARRENRLIASQHLKR